MKLSLLSIVALSATAITARFIEKHEQDQVILSNVVDEERYLVEVAPGELMSVTEEDKWELRRSGRNFMDITDNQDLGGLKTSAVKVEFPSKPVLQEALTPLLKNLSKSNMQANLETFTSFHTRYYKSDYGRQSSEWLLENVQGVIKNSGADKYGAYAKHFIHPWGQNSVIATIPGKSNSTVVVGAHQDSINLFLPSILSAPGADDDGSGTVTILEALRVLLTSRDVIKGKGENTIEFHWYSAEEGGLLGSQAIFSEYQKAGRNIKAMLQQDMTGYVQRTLDAGEKESVGVITDFVDPGLTDYIKKVVTEYCEIPYVETKCGYACSDHASASKAGYPSAFVIESDFKYSDNHIHTSDDLIKYLSFDHMLQHARLTLGLVYELAFARSVPPPDQQGSSYPSAPALESLSLSPSAGITLSIPLNSHDDADATPKSKVPRESVRRDNQNRREVLLKGKEGSRRRQRWENDRLLHVPNVQLPLPSDWEVHPTYPVHTVPYYLAPLWDAGLRAHSESLAASKSKAAKTKTGVKEEKGRVPAELRQKLKKAKGAKSLLQDLEEEVRKFVREWEGKKKEGEEVELDSEDEEIVFVGRDGGMSDETRKKVEEELQREKLVWDSRVDDKGASFGRWLVHEIAAYYGLSSRSITVGNPARREAYVGIKEMKTGHRSSIGGEELPLPLWEVVLCRLGVPDILEWPHGNYIAYQFG
ncbi:hypothetical protein B7494_g123 [Chlorociboria aeruginascens]|nr:hypothetical protein B7494_g123 [Chlorociboria aeruginascens]